MKYIRYVLIVSSIIFIAACSNQAPSNQAEEDTFSKDVGEFAAVTQSGEAFNVSDLKGKWWVADFIFTNCTTVCLPMTANMVTLQGMLEEEGLDEVQLVSFSVDPERDTPEALLAYAEENEADLDRWTFLTGYEFEEIESYAIDVFKNWVAPPQEGDDQIDHATYFFLVNPDGRIESHYSGTKSEQMEDIINDLKRLTK